MLGSLFALPEITYERLLTDNSSVGLSIMFSVDNENDNKFGITPHYRVYFGKKKANGFFLEGNATIVKFEEYYQYSQFDMKGNMILFGSNIDKYTSFGMGIAAGTKFLGRNGLFGEAYLGAGRFFNPNGIEAYPRIGVTIGKRF